VGLAEEAQKKNDMVAVQADLPVMVWGPGTKKPHYEKRKQIRDVVQEKFKHTDVFFPEDRMELSEFSMLDSDEDKEAAMTVSSEAVLSLETKESEGSRQEGARYIHISPEKLFVMIHKDYEGSDGYPAKLRGKVKKYFYPEEELDITDSKLELSHSLLKFDSGP